jgi:hypothetical protein
MSEERDDQERPCLQTCSQDGAIRQQLIERLSLPKIPSGAWLVH